MRALNIYKLLGRTIALVACLLSVSLANAQMLNIKIKGQTESRIHHIFKGNEQAITRVEIGKLTDDMKHIVFEPTLEDINKLKDSFYQGIGTEEMATLSDGSKALHVTPESGTAQIDLGFNLPYMPDGTYEATLVMAPLCMLRYEDLRGGKLQVSIWNTNEKGVFTTNNKYRVNFENPDGSGKNFLFESSTDEAVMPLGTVDLNSNFYETERVLRISTSAKSTEVKQTYAREFIVKRIEFTRKDNDDADYVKMFGENGLRNALPINDIETVNCCETTQLEARYKSISEGTELKMTNAAFADFPNIQEMNANVNISYDRSHLPDYVYDLPAPSRKITFVRTGEQEFTANVPLLSPSVDTKITKEYEVTAEHELFAGTFSLSAKDMVEPCKWTLTRNNIGDKGEKLDFTRSLQLKADVSALTQEQWSSLSRLNIQTIMLFFDANGNFVHSCEEGIMERNEERHTLSTELLMSHAWPITPSSEYNVYVAFVISEKGNSVSWSWNWISQMENPAIPVWFSEKFTFTTPSQEEYDKAKAYAQERYIASLLPNVMAEDENISIYNEAIKATQINKLMEAHEDDTYTIGKDSCDWTNGKLCIHVASEVDNVAYPKKRYFNFTAFVVPDAILAEKYGITTLDDLRKKAHEIYDPLYPEDADVTDETDRRNALNKFISYHVLDRYGDYYTLTANDNDLISNAFYRNKYDIRDWYGTLMPHSTMKFSFPSGSQTGLYINRRGIQSHADERGVFVQGSKVTAPEEYKVVPTTAVNGIYHYIDDIVAYDATMQQVVMDDHIRVNSTAISPDFMTKLTDGEVARGHTSGDGNKYGNSQGENWNPLTNKDRSVGFKSGYTRNFTFSENTHMHVRNRMMWFWCYEGDEIIFKGRYDFTIKLPSVPAGTYEVRIQTCTGFNTRGIVQPYIDGVPQGEPQDLRPSGQDIFGWKSDNDITGEVVRNNRELSEEELEKKKQEAIAAFDKEIHAKGWVKAPKCCVSSLGNTAYEGSGSMRDLNNVNRWVIGTFTTDGKSDHYLRLQQMTNNPNDYDDFYDNNYELNLDFIELVPSTVYNNPEWPESLY